MNRVVLIGRLTKNPELKTTPNGVSVVRFTLAVNRDYAKKGEERQANFISCVAWRDTAEFLSKYFQKGKMIALEGHITTGSYDDNGKKVYTSDVTAEKIYFCDSGKKSNGSDTADTVIKSFEGISDDDMPF